jgi:hypothetical protein
MRRLKLLARVSGVCVFAVGLLSLDLFVNLADLGMLAKAAVVLIPAGVALIVLSYVLLADDGEDLQ